MFSIFCTQKIPDYSVSLNIWEHIFRLINRGYIYVIFSIKTWDYQDSWEYCVDYLGEEEHEFDNRYRFRVRWSIPTRRKPIPRSTACVYFTFQVSKIKPKVKNVMSIFLIHMHWRINQKVLTLIHTWSRFWLKQNKNYNFRFRGHPLSKTFLSF